MPPTKQSVEELRGLSRAGEAEDDENYLPQVNEWQTGLFQCWQDVHLTFVGGCCPHCLFADNVTRLDPFALSCPSHCSYFMLCLFLGCTLVAGQQRFELRSKFGIPQEPCNDYAVHLFCSPCALCQEAREIKRRSRVETVPQLADQLRCEGRPPEMQQISRQYSHGLALEDWEWDASQGRVGAPRVHKSILDVPRAAPVAIEGLGSRTTAGGSRKGGDGSTRGASAPASTSAGAVREPSARRLPLGSTSPTVAPLSPLLSRDGNDDGTPVGPGRRGLADAGELELPGLHGRGTLPATAEERADASSES